MESNQIGFLLKTITDKLKTDAETDFKKYNITFAQSRVLAYLNKCGGQTTQKDLEDHLCVSHPTVVGIVSRMEQNGYVTCRFDPDNKRNKIIERTEKAIFYGEEINKVTRQKEKSLVSGLSEKQVEELRKMLEIIYINIT